jgi:hypothetical protein
MKTSWCPPSSVPGTPGLASGEVVLRLEGHRDRARGVTAIGGPNATPLPAVSRHNVDGVDNRAEIREFLTTRRAKVTTEQAELQRGGARAACAACGEKRSPSLPG